MLENQNAQYHKKGLTLAEQLKRKDRNKKIKKRRIIFTTLSIIGILLISPLAVAAYKLYNFNSNLNRSDILGNNNNLSEDLNILIMGLDSRVDQNGNPFPVEIYEALHAGNADDGGYNSNVLMVAHIPKDSSKTAQIFSIPRDSYVELTGTNPQYNQEGKIKEAYGLAVAQKQQQLYGSELSQTEAYQKARDAGRIAQIATVENFIGNNIKINHFVEINMAGFYQIAQAVQPIQVCLNYATKDIYSGADFQAGLQEISAEQAVAFVRQRRDYYNTEIQLTDLDRSRRQQAYIASILYKLRDLSTYTNLSTNQKILDAIQNNMTVDSKLNVFDIGPKLLKVMNGNTTFTTLPIRGFGTSAYGQSINLVDVDEVQETVRKQLNPTTPQEETPNNETQPNAPSQLQQETPNNETQPNAPTTPEEDTTRYENWEVPLFSNNNIPCVN